MPAVQIETYKLSGMKRCNCEHPLPPQSGPVQHTGSRLYPDVGPRPMPFHPIAPLCHRPIPEPFRVSSNNKTVIIDGTGYVTVTRTDGVYDTTYTVSFDGIPSASTVDHGKVLSVGEDGTPEWTSFESDGVGSAILDEGGNPLFDEDSSSITPDLWTGFSGKGFGAIRSYGDQDGNNIKATYVKKAELTEALVGLGGARLLRETCSASSSVSVGNNRVTSISGLTGSITINVSVPNGEASMAVIELTTSTVADNSVVAVTVNGNPASCAESASVVLASDKKYQVVCLGTCWSMCEYKL